MNTNTLDKCEIQQADVSHDVDIMPRLSQCLLPGVATLRRKGIEAYKLDKPRVLGSTSKYFAYGRSAAGN